MKFQNRIEAGELLADELMNYKDASDTVVLALARGGVEVGFSLSKKLFLPLEVLVVRKLGVPGNEELAMGAITENGESVINREIILNYGVTQQELDFEKNKELEVLKTRMTKYISGTRERLFEGKNIILIDDGIATGSTAKVAIAFLRKKKVKKIVLAVPVAPMDTANDLKKYVDTLVVIYTPEYFGSVGQFYKNFNQVTDEEVKKYLL